VRSVWHNTPLMLIAIGAAVLLIVVIGRKIWRRADRRAAAASA
jgi:hypothetical protein